MNSAVNGPIDPVKFAQSLIRCNSVTPADGGALPLLAETLRAQGFDCELIRFTSPGTPDILNLWARRGSGCPHFCYAGHSDVVPVIDRDQWRADPFGGSIEEGLLVGRGAVDMKGSIAAFAAAATQYLAANPDFDGSISLMITGDEEGPSINGTIKILQWLTKKGIQLDACLVGEPASLDSVGDTVKIGRRGSLNGWLTVTGIGGHTAYPQRADNAAHTLVAMISSLLAEPLDKGTEHFEPSTLQFSTIDIGNPATNVIPGTAHAVFNVRFNDAWTADRVESRLRHRLDQIGKAYVLDIKVSGESFLTPPNAFAEIVAQSVEAQTGRRPEFSTGGGTSDARFIHHFCPVAELGLVGQTMHKRDEAVSLSDLQALTGIYRDVLQRFFKQH